MKKLFMIANVMMLILILILDACYMANGGLLLKAMTSLMFVVTGCINLIYCIKKKVNLKFHLWMMLGLIGAMGGDILLGINFYIGAVAFAVENILYIISYCMLEKINIRELLYGMGISVIILAIILWIPFLDFRNAVTQDIGCVYAVIISFMVGKAISNLVNENNFVNRIIGIGSVLFLISDFMLMLHLFGNISVANYLCLGTYYPAQFLLAFSLFGYATLHNN